jgi:thiol-disulfide isomerase/thioredoxin
MKRRACLLAGLAAMASVPAWSAESPEGKDIQWPELRLLDGETLVPASWRGQPAIVVVWATYCPFCKRHNAHIDKLARQMRGQPLRILGLATDKDEAAVRRYMSANNYHFPVALDNGGLRSQLTPRRAIPMTCTIDRNGQLIQAIPGEMFEEDVMDLANKLMQRAA